MAKKKTEQEKPVTTELVVVQNEFLETVQNSGLELTKAEKYAAGYAPLMGEVIEQAALLKGLDKTKSEDAAKAKRVSLDLGKICSRLSDKKKSDKEIILVETRLIDGLFNVAESTARLTQSEANDIVDYLPSLERERIAALRLTRIAELSEYGADKSYLPLDTMTEEQYASLLEDVKLAFNARREAVEREERELIEREEKAAQEQAEREEAERLRLEEQERELVELKAENERMEVERIENEKLRVAIRDRMSKYAIKNITPYGFTKCETGMENREFGLLARPGEYSNFDTEEEMLKWVEDIKAIVRAYTERQTAEIELEKSRIASKEQAERAAKENEEWLIQQQLRRDNADKFVAALIFEGFESDENEISWSKGGSWDLTYDQLADMGESEFDEAVAKINNWNIERIAKEREEKRLRDELETERKNNAAKEEREAEQSRRRELLFGLGLKWDGENFIYNHIIIHWTDVLTMEVEKFNKLYERAAKDVQQIQLEEQKAAEKIRLENERIAKELADEKERQFQEQFVKEKDAKAALLAPDKDKLTVLYVTIDAIQLPNVTSPEAKAITKLVNNTLADLKKQFVELAKTMV